MSEYAILYIRPDGWWVAGEGWGSYREARKAADEHFAEYGRSYGTGYKIAVVGKRPHCEAKELEAREAA